MSACLLHTCRMKLSQECPQCVFCSSKTEASVASPCDACVASRDHFSVRHSRRVKSANNAIKTRTNTTHTSGNPTRNRIVITKYKMQLFDF